MRTNRKTFLTLLIAMSCLLIFGSAKVNGEEDNWAERFESGMTPQLEEALSTLQPGETLDVYAVMTERVSFEQLNEKVKDVRSEDKHKVVTELLTAFARQSQAPIRDFLEARDGGRCSGAGESPLALERDPLQR